MKNLSAFAQWFNRTSTGYGSFATSLFETFINGSQDNRIRLEVAFPDYFNKDDHKLDF